MSTARSTKIYAWNQVFRIEFDRLMARAWLSETFVTIVFFRFISWQERHINARTLFLGPSSA